MDALETARLWSRPFTMEELDAAHRPLDRDLRWPAPGFTIDQRRERLAFSIALAQWGDTGQLDGYRAITRRPVSVLIGLRGFLPCLWSARRRAAPSDHAPIHPTGRARRVTRPEARTAGGAGRWPPRRPAILSTDIPRMADSPPGRPRPLRVEYTPLGARTARVALADAAGQHTVIFESTALGDGLRELADAVVALLRGADGATVRWQDEPGETRWVLERAGDELVVTVRRFAATYSHRADAEGERVFVARGRLAGFAGQVKSQLEAVLAAHGATGYRMLTGREFPGDAYERLAALVRMRKAGRDAP